MARTDPQINIRVAADLKKKLELLAVENGRSLNAEVVSRLEKSLLQNEDIESADMKDKLVDLEDTVDAIRHELKRIQDQLTKPDGK